MQSGVRQSQDFILELKRIRQDGEGGGFLHSQVESILKEVFKDQKEIFVPNLTHCAGEHASLFLPDLKEQGFKYIAFSLAVNNKHQVAV